MNVASLTRQELIRLLRQKENLSLRRFQRIDIPKGTLESLIHEGKSNQEIALHFKVSERTVCRRVREYGLKGLRKKGRKPPSKPRQKKESERWISVERYIDKLNRKYHFVNIQYPHTKYINPKTKICSNVKANPNGEYTTAGFYYVVENSGVNLLYRTRIRYSDEPVPFDEISHWVRKNGKDILANMWLENQLTIIEIVAYTFLNPDAKPRQVVISQGGEGHE
jgi:transposase